MLDDETGEALYQRADDTAEALKTRLVRRSVSCRRFCLLEVNNGTH